MAKRKSKFWTTRRKQTFENAVIYSIVSIAVIGGIAYAGYALTGKTVVLSQQQQKK